MAGDWIRIRQDLFSHPRFLSLCAELIYRDDRPDMLLHIFSPLKIDTSAVTKSNDTVTDIALRTVTESALHDVTMCALLRVWCAVNAHCKVDGNDAVMTPMDRFDVDKIAGFSGFGEAMCEVGWAIDDGRNSLRFPNFLEFNEPACLRARPRTNAERQRLYREKRRAAADVKTGEKKRVTKVTKSNDREEKRREEYTDTVVSVSRAQKNTTDIDSMIAKIYAAYPRKAGRGIALKAIRSALEKIDGESLLSLVEAFAEARKGLDQQFTPHPATWFNQERWADDPSTWRMAGNGTAVRDSQRHGSAMGATREQQRQAANVDAIADFVARHSSAASVHGAGIRQGDALPDGPEADG